MLFGHSLLVVAALTTINDAAPIPNCAVETKEVKRESSNYYYRSKKAHVEDDAPEKQTYHYYSKKADVEDATFEKRAHHYYSKKADVEDATPEKRAYYYN